MHVQRQAGTPASAGLRFAKQLFRALHPSCPFDFDFIFHEKKNVLCLHEDILPDIYQREFIKGFFFFNRKSLSKLIEIFSKYVLLIHLDSSELFML